MLPLDGLVRQVNPLGALAARKVRSGVGQWILDYGLPAGTRAINLSLRLQWSL
jgi:hypothetical protein